MKFRNFLRPFLIILAITLLSVVLLLYAVSGNIGEKISGIVESKTGMQCSIAGVKPCFPLGIKVSGVSISSKSGEPFLQADEMSAQIDLLRYLIKGRKQNDLFNKLGGDHVKLTLVRNENGEWNFPRSLTSEKSPGSNGDRKKSERRILFENIEISVKTSKGEAKRLYKRMEADSNPENDTVSLKLSGADESVRISYGNAAEKLYEMQAENFSMSLLAPIASSPFPLENLSVDGKIRATEIDKEKYALEAAGRIKISSFEHAVLSSRKIEDINLPFELNGQLSGSGIENLNGKIDMGGEFVNFHGKIENWKKPSVDIALNFTDFSYNKAIAAFPASLHPSLSVINLSGRMSGTFKLFLDTGNPESLDYSYNGQVEPLRILNLGNEINIHTLKSPFRHKVRTKRGKGVSIFLGSQNPDYTPIRNIPTSAISAVITAEDGGFFSHKGFSKKHIRDSLVENLKAQKVVRGASTISMQLAKNLFLSPERTLSRKFEEALITIAIEQNIEKKRIMEIYLNIIEWGNGVYGIGQASKHYFSKKPEELKPVESAFLASIIARPRSNWRPDPLQKIGKGWWEYLHLILCKMYEMGEAEVEDLLEAGVSESRIAGLKQGGKKRIALRF